MHLQQNSNESEAANNDKPLKHQGLSSDEIIKEIVNLLD
jgi:hypothetical protein